MIQLHVKALREALKAMTGVIEKRNAIPIFGQVLLTDPLRWRKPRRVFVCAHGDLFHESVHDETIDLIFEVMRRASQHQFQVLTKRAGRMRTYIESRWRVPGVAHFYGLPDDADVYQHVPNIWLGVSVEDQQRADERIPHLMETPTPNRFLSIEPLLGPIDLSFVGAQVDQLDGGHPGGDERFDANVAGYDVLGGKLIGYDRTHDGHLEWPQVLATGGNIGWVIVGGESGPGARPMQAEWVRSLRDDCARNSVPFFFKQWGNHLPSGQMQADGRVWKNGSFSPLCTTKAFAGRYLDGLIHDGMPAHG